MRRAARRSRRRLFSFVVLDRTAPLATARGGRPAEPFDDHSCQISAQSNFFLRRRLSYIKGLLRTGLGDPAFWGGCDREVALDRLTPGFADHGIH